MNLKNIFRLLQKKFRGLTRWQKVLLVSITRITGSAIFIGWANSYALYYYAIRNGFRVPLESVEYLGFTVSLISFLIFFTSVSISLFIYFLLNEAGKKLIKEEGAERQAKIRKYRTNSMIFLILVQFALIGVAVSLWIWNRLYHDNNSYYLAYIGVSFVFLSLSTLLFVTRPLFENKSTSSIFSSLMVLLGSIIIILGLFDQTLYTYFLKTIKYGGGTSIIVEYRAADTEDERVGGKLMLNTKNSIFVGDSTTNVQEIPKVRISKITYIQKGEMN